MGLKLRMLGRGLIAASGLIGAPASHGLAGTNQLDRLPVLDPSVLVAGASSHARDGSNTDFGPYLERSAAGGYVLMESQGPGAITRIWMTGPVGTSPTGDTRPFGHLQFFFDGEQKPRIDLPAHDFYAGRTSSLPAPLCGDFTVSSGGNYCDVRLPFAKSIRVVSTASPAYYNFGYETYPQGTRVASFDPAAGAALRSVEAARRLFSRSGGDPRILSRGRTHSGTTTVPAAGGATLVHLAHRGTIRAIRLSLDHFDDTTLRSVWLKVTWDHQNMPAVSAPLADLFLSGAGERTPAKGLLAGYLPSLHQGYLYFPMPFARDARIELVNNSAAPVTASWTVQESPATYAGIGRRTGYFHATYNSDPATTTGTDYTLLDASGAGKVVGLSYTEEGIVGAQETLFMEGDERVYFDGSRSPAIYGTGTEDLFSGAYYYTTNFTLPDHGATTKEDVSPGIARTSQYRLLVSDPWPFRDGIHFGIEHGAGDGQQTANHSVVYWYGTGRSELEQTDAFDVANPTPGSAYAGAGTPTELTAFFEGDHDGNVSLPFDGALLGAQSIPAGLDLRGESTTADGRNHVAGSTISFDVNLDPANRGAIIRRLLDQGTFGQRAEVLVDGKRAGIWFTPGSNPTKRWAESDFQLPAALTAGKRRIAVQLRVLSAWTDYGYVTFSVRDLPAGWVGGPVRSRRSYRTVRPHALLQCCFFMPSPTRRSQRHPSLRRP